jgi:photosystem I P700 chlorophyll a apoprotein A1
MYNSLSIAIFHFSWKNAVWGTVNASGIYITGGNFAQMQILSTVGYVILWAQSSSYSIIRFISVWFNFLGAHFIWAFSLMFLFSGRGYWQELIESIVWAHNKLVVPAIQPRALSITRSVVGVATTYRWYCNNLGLLEARIISVG